MAYFSFGLRRLGKTTSSTNGEELLLKVVHADTILALQYYSVVVDVVAGVLRRWHVRSLTLRRCK